jgi:hypothetical protein
MPLHLGDALLAAVTPLSPAFRDEGAPLWQAEHLERLADRLTSLRGGVVDRPPPVFAEETTPPLEPLFAPWRPILAEMDTASDPLPVDALTGLAFRLEATGLDGLLLLLGMRRTPGSLSGAAAVPPTTRALLLAAEQPFRDGESLSTAGRAWTKHVPRSGEAFWGTVQGGAADHSRTAVGLLRRILKDATWWNTYTHFQRGTVFEARIPTGHGARWQVAGPAFVGFLEPFQEGGIEGRE